MRLPRLPRLPSHPAEPGKRGAESSLHAELAANLRVLRRQVADSDDVVIREVSLGPRRLPAALLLVEELTDPQAVEGRLLSALTVDFPEEAGGPSSPVHLLDRLRSRILPLAGVETVGTFDDLVLGVLSGAVALLVEGSADALLLTTPSQKGRQIAEPPAESVIRGSREGFVEDLRTNLALLRRSLRNPSLKVRVSLLGRRTRTRVALVYVADLVNQEVLAEVRGRLDTLDADRLTSSGQLEQLLEDDWLSPFPQVEATERTDRVVLALLDGRLALIVDGSSFAMIIPTTFNSLMLSPEDYNLRWHMGSFIRLVRFFAVPLTLLLPGLYLALITFHPEMLPTQLMVSIGFSELDVPYPAVVEVLLMETAIELIREAVLRMPSQLRQAIGVVAGLIVGEAAVRAGLVSNVTVVVMATTAIGSYAIPNYALAFTLRMLRFALIVAAGAFGLYGLITGFIFILVHLCTLKSFGVYYLSPLAPARFQSWLDTVFRAPLPALKTRPKEFAPQDEVRLADRREE